MRKVIGLFLLFFFSSAVLAAGPYIYSFPKPDKSWGKAVAFNNLSPGFFQVMYMSPDGIIRIATYGIVGASMDALRDPQLIMVFKFDQEKTAGQVETQQKVAQK